MPDFQDGGDHIALGSVAFDSLTIVDSKAGAVITFHGGSDMTLTGIPASQLTTPTSSCRDGVCPERSAA